MAAANRLDLSQPVQKASWLLRLLSIVALIFGAMTIRSGGMVLFTTGAEHQAAGNYVPFVLWFNFAAGFAYLLAALGLWLQRGWGVLLAAVIALSTIVVFMALGVHIATGGAYEMRTLAAMTLRSGLWVLIAVIAQKHVPSNN